MFVSLDKNGTSSGSGQSMVKTLAGILAGSITSTTQLDSNFFTQASSFFETGSYSTSYWSVESDNSSSSGSGTIILSSPSRLSNGRKNYLALNYLTTYFWCVVCDSLVGGAMQNSTEAYCNNDPALSSHGFSSNYDAFISAKMNICFANGFVLIWSPTCWPRYLGSASYRQSYLFLGLEMTSNPYDAYSLEGTFKAFSFWGYSGWAAGAIAATIGISNMYQPKTDTYVSSSRWMNSYNNYLTSNGTLVGPTRCSSTLTAAHLIVPITFNRFNVGWMGANVSEKSGLYLSTSIVNGWPVTNDDFVTLGTDTFRVFSPGASGVPMASATLLIKI